MELAHDRGWNVQIIATPAALAFIDAPKLEAQSGRPVRSEYRSPGELRSPQADAIIVAPATYNTINKWANGISDTYALGILAEAPGLGIPVVVLPFVNSALAGRAPFKESMNELRGEGIRILLGPGEFEPHPRGSGGDRISEFPWQLAMASVPNDPERAPRDAELGVAGASMSPGMRKMTARAAAALPFARAGSLLADLAGIRLSARRIERSSEADGQAAAAAIARQASAVAARRLAVLPAAGPLPDKLYIAIYAA